MRKKELEKAFNKLKISLGVDHRLLQIRVEQLEKENKELDEKLELVSKKLSALQEAFVFVNLHGKDTIHIEKVFCKWGFRPRVEYLYADKVCTCNFPIDPHSSICELKVIENKLRSAIIEIELVDGELFSMKKQHYYYLDKSKGLCTKIPKPACVLEKELAEQEQSAKKTTSEKKESKKK